MHLRVARRNMRNVYAAAAVLLVTVACAPSGTVNDDDVLYTVVFADKPSLSEGYVYLGDQAIGTVRSVRPAQGPFVLDIAVAQSKSALLRASAVFVVADGRLEHSRVGTDDVLLTSDAKVLGFADRLALYWFKTKTASDDLSAAAQAKARALYENMSH